MTGINNAALRAAGRPMPGDAPTIVTTESGAHWSEEWVWEGDAATPDSPPVKEEDATSEQ